MPLSPNKSSTLNEIKVFTADDKSVMVPLHNGINTSADSILELALSYVNIEVEAGRDIFALWIVSSSLELQLKPTHKPVRYIYNFLNKQFKFILSAHSLLLPSNEHNNIHLLNLVLSCKQIYSHHLIIVVVVINQIILQL